MPVRAAVRGRFALSVRLLEGDAYQAVGQLLNSLLSEIDGGALRVLGVRRAA
jgi:hypothetical protein